MRLRRRLKLRSMPRTDGRSPPTFFAAASCLTARRRGLSVGRRETPRRHSALRPPRPPRQLAHRPVAGARRARPRRSGRQRLLGHRGRRLRDIHGLRHVHVLRDVPPLGLLHPPKLRERRLPGGGGLRDLQPHRLLLHGLVRQRQRLPRRLPLRHRLRPPRLLRGRPGRHARPVAQGAGSQAAPHSREVTAPPRSLGAAPAGPSAPGR